MLLILSLFLVCTVITPSAGELLRHRQRAARQRRQVEALLREGSIADYRLD